MRFAPLARLAALAGALAAGVIATAAAPAEARPVMVAAAHPLAAEAGLAVLEEGGSAADAAVVVQLVLGLVEPQSSGIGGGAFALYYDAADKQVTAYDGREVAPAAAGPDLFLKDGQPMAFREAVVGGRSVGVPGVPALLELLHRQHGTLPWPDLFKPAIALAEKGFPISPRLAESIARDQDLATFPPTRAYFFEADGSPKAADTLLRNPAYAETLRRMAEGGAEAFYTGPTAEAIVAAVQQANGNPGRITMQDLSGYNAIERRALCATYHGYEVCGAPPPTSGGLAVLQTLGILANFQMDKAAPMGLDAVHLLTDAERLAFADRNAYVGDPAFVTVPVSRLLDPTYLRQRAALMNGNASIGKAQPGKVAQAGALGVDHEPPSTTHFVVVDADGDVVSMTSSVEGPFGSKLMAAGFVLNNELTDFSFVPQVEGIAVANRVEPGKRPRSSMSPMIVLDGNDAPAFAVGSPGGSRIIGYVAQALIALIDWKLPPQEAVSLGHALSRNGPTELETGRFPEEVIAGLKARGHEIRQATMDSGLQAVAFGGGSLVGGADPRREGVALLGDAP